MVLLDHFANKSNTFQHSLSLPLSLSLSLSRSPISSHFLLGSPLPPILDTRITQLKVPCPPHTIFIPMEFLWTQSINKIGNILRNGDGSEWSLVSDHRRTFPKFPPPRVHKSRTSKSVSNICGHFFHKKTHPSSNYIDFLESNTLTMIFAVKIIVWQQEFRHIHT